MSIKKIWLDYCIWSFLVPKIPKFPKFVRWLDNGNFYSLKFYNFIPKRVIGRLFDYYGIAPKEEKNLVHSKFQGIIFDIKFLLNWIFKDQEFSKYTGLDKGRTKHLRMRNYSMLIKLDFIKNKCEDMLVVKSKISLFHKLQSQFQNYFAWLI